MRFPLPTGQPLPGPLRSIGIQVLCSTFARVFDVQAPRVAALPANRALWAFREFSAACMEEALASPEYAAARRAQLGEQARKLGAQVRHVLRPADGELPRVIRALYAAIEIDVTASREGTFTFRRCFFAGRYTPALCAFMSAFDSGFVGGLYGAGELAFDTRITAGAPCCHACLSGFAERHKAR